MPINNDPLSATSRGVVVTPWPGTAIRDGAMSGGTHLRLEERERLAALKAEGLSLRAIAARLGRAASTVSRELRRNALPRGGYLPVHAEGCYLERRQRPAILERDAKLGRFVRERLLEGWTPEQIAGWLKRGEERGLRAVSSETIYAFIHRPGQKAEKLWKLLPRGRAKAGPAAGSSAARHHRRAALHPRPARGRRRSATRPATGRATCLICRRTRPVLVLKERKTRFVLAARLAGKSAAETVAVMMAVFRRLDPRLRASITFDNDTAFARHGLLASACAMTTWFCDAYASWQKGAVENANGRLRRDLPRDLDLDALSDAELQEIVLTHNLTPRKCLGFLTPLQALLEELGRDVRSLFATPVAPRSGTTDARRTGRGATGGGHADRAGREGRAGRAPPMRRGRGGGGGGRGGPPPLPGAGGPRGAPLSSNRGALAEGMAGSSMVAGTFTSLPSASFFMVPRRILPERVLGRRLTTATSLKAATGPISSRTLATSSFWMMRRGPGSRRP